MGTWVAAVAARVREDGDAAEVVLLALASSRLLCQSICRGQMVLLGVELATQACLGCPCCCCCCPWEPEKRSPLLTRQSQTAVPVAQTEMMVWSPRRQQLQQQSCRLEPWQRGQMHAAVELLYERQQRCQLAVHVHCGGVRRDGAAWGSLEVTLAQLLQPRRSAASVCQPW